MASILSDAFILLSYFKKNGPKFVQHFLFSWRFFNLILEVEEDGEEKKLLLFKKKLKTKKCPMAKTRAKYWIERAFFFIKACYNC